LALMMEVLATLHAQQVADTVKLIKSPESEGQSHDTKFLRARGAGPRSGWKRYAHQHDVNSLRNVGVAESRMRHVTREQILTFCNKLLTPHLLTRRTDAHWSLLRAALKQALLFRDR
jgi:hypothetical protein